MSRHQIDTSTVYDPKTDEGAFKEIEKAEVDPIKKDEFEKEQVPCEPYIPDASLIEAVNLSIALGRPLLLQGDPGCGKTRLAYAVAYNLGLPLELSYIKSTSRAQDLLYIYDAVGRLYDSQIPAQVRKKSVEIENYIKYGPLGRAIIRAQNGRRSVVLIDEIDKADLDFPNDLLWELDRLEFKVSEAPDISFSAGDEPTLRPIVIVTHNEEKALPPAFLRRCIFHYVEFPKTETELEKILDLHHKLDTKLRDKAIEVLQKLRKMDLRKKPGLSELIDWVGYLSIVETPEKELDKLPYIGALLKQQPDQIRAKQEISKS